MPGNLSSKPDVVILMLILLMLIVVLAHYNNFLGAFAFLVWLLAGAFIIERTLQRTKNFNSYCNNVLGIFNDIHSTALNFLPVAILLVDNAGLIQWFNPFFKKIFPDANQGSLLDDICHNLPADDSIFSAAERHLLVNRHQIKNMSLIFLQDVSALENLKTEYLNNQTAVAYVQIDNYDELTRGLSEAEKSSLLLSTNQILDAWVANLRGFICKVDYDLFLVLINRAALLAAVNQKFSLLDQTRKLLNKNQIPVTLSAGIAVADSSLDTPSDKALAGLQLALGRGGDQVAVFLDDKWLFFGGKAKAVEKNTRVKARVISHSIRDTMSNADEIFIMGHTREDYDSFGAAAGIALMAKLLNKPTHIVLSSYNDSIQKILDLFNKDDSFKNLFVNVNDASAVNAVDPLLVVVDTFIPHLVAAPQLLSIKNIIVIDHHRRAEHSIKNPAIAYLEPGSSSACELVTELLMYFDDNIKLGKLTATALYSGIVVDTKNFTVQTGARTFDAAAYLRRAGADPVAVNHLFKDDFDTAVALAKTKAKAHYFEGGLVLSTIDKIIPNVQVIAGQAADSLLRVDGVNVSIILFQINPTTVGISARSSGDFNVQILMEHFGGGGHQNVAGAQVRNVPLPLLVKSVLRHAQHSTLCQC